MRNILLSAVMLAVAALGAASASGAGDQPYAPDDDTLLLMHFDGSFDNAAKSGVKTAAPDAAYAEGKFGKALECSTVGKTVVPLTSDQDPENALTLECWVRYDGPGEGLTQRVAGRGSAYGFYFHSKRPELTWYVKTAAGKWVSAGGVIPEKEWTHIAGTYDGQNVRLFVNGNLVSESANPGTIAKAGQPFYLARTGARGAKAQHFNGLIDELRLSSVVRPEFQAAKKASMSAPAPATRRVAAAPEAPVKKKLASPLAGLFDRKIELERGDATLTLARDGQARMDIVAPDDAPAVVRFAAEELKLFLDRIAGADFQIVPKAGADRPAIILGAGPEAKAAGIDVETIARDGFQIVATPERVVIAGRDDPARDNDVLFGVKGEPAPPGTHRHELYKTLGDAVWAFERGTLYGVYRFLEELDCRWFVPGPKGMFVPSKPTLETRTFTLLEEPAFDQRLVGPTVWTADEVSKNAAKYSNPEAYDDLEWTGKANRLWLLRNRGHTTVYPLNHRVPLNKFEQRFGEEHPEYFSLYRGKRDLERLGGRGRTGVLCYSSEGMFEETMLDAEAFWAGKSSAERGILQYCSNKNPFNRGWFPAVAFGDGISLLPHDAYKPCGCPDCAKYLRSDQAGQNSDLLWRFVARVGREVERRWPDKFVTCLTYSSYTKLPKTIDSLPNNVMIGICPSKLNKIYNIVGREGYAELFDHINQWDKMNDAPMAFWFHQLYRIERNNPGHYAVPMVLPHFFARFVKDLSRYGRVFKLEMDRDNPLYEGLNRYVLMKLLTNPDLDVDALLDDIFDKRYGPASHIVKATMLEIERQCEAIAADSAARVDIWKKYFDPKTLKRYREAADEAVRATAGTPYEDAARLFADHFVGFMEKGYQAYERNVKVVANMDDAVLVSHRARPTPIAVDGKLDEASWDRAPKRSFVSVVDGKPTSVETTVQSLATWHEVHFAFVCELPEGRPLVADKPERLDIFLDGEHSHSVYAWIAVDSEGKIEERYILGEGEPNDDDWKSGAQIAIDKGTDRWVVEMSIPRSVIIGDNPRLGGNPWGVNFCRTMADPSRDEDRRSCFSPLLRGDFEQPGLFGHMVFEE